MSVRQEALVVELSLSPQFLFLGFRLRSVFSSVFASGEAEILLLFSSSFDNEILLSSAVFESFDLNLFAYVMRHPSIFMLFCQSDGVIFAIEIVEHRRTDEVSDFEGRSRVIVFGSLS